MRATIRSLLAVAAIAAAPAMARAQDSTAANDKVQSAKILDHTFTASVGEPVRVFLAKDVTYRVELDGVGIQLQLRPLDMSVQRPLIQNTLGGASAAGVSLYSVKPRADAEYEFVSSGGDGMRPVSLHVVAQPVKAPKPPKPVKTAQ